MTKYIYPKNLKATASLWLWGLKDFLIIGIAALLSVLAIVHLNLIVPAVLTLVYAFLTIRFDNATVLDFLRYATNYLILSQQYYEWR